MIAIPPELFTDPEFTFLGDPEKAYRDFAAITEVLYLLIGNNVEAQIEWWKAPNKYLGGQSPIILVLTGRTQEIYDAKQVIDHPVRPE